MYIINYFLVENYLEKKTFLDWMKFTNFSLSSSIKKNKLGITRKRFCPDRNDY